MNLNRPVVQIDKPNRCDSLLDHLNSHLHLFTELPGVVGVTLSGGLARGYGDHLSEIDVTIYLESPVYTHWQQGNAPIGTGIQRVDGELYDIKICDFAREQPDHWTDDARWDASYARVLYDPTGVVSKLLAQNEQHRPRPLDAGGVMFAAWWHYRLVGDIWIYREDSLQAHFMLNQALTDIVKALYIANGEFIPHHKWLFHMSRTLRWTPDHWISRLTQIMCDLAPTINNVRSRQQHIDALWHEIDDHLRAAVGATAAINMTHLTHYTLLRMLVEQPAVSTTEWQQRADLSLLNQAPFNLCTEIVDNRVVLDRDRLVALTPQDLYAWHYAVVQAVNAQ